jgi:D-xylose 1-dehydrogenase (NADP+, D-xylono-1,5-lactone-forming)
MAGAESRDSGAEPLTWGILATGQIADDVMPGLQRSSTNRVKAVGSRSAERAEWFARRYSLAAAYGSYAALLADPDVQCVYICLPNGLHAQWVREALSAGKHVLCEKPLTPTEEQARELFDLAARRGLVLAEAFMYRHHPKTRRLRELVASGSLGEIRTIRASFSFLAANPDNDIRYDPLLAGGALFDVGCYCVSMANYLEQDQPAEVSGIARYAASGVDEQFCGTMTYPSGTVAVFDCAMNAALSTRVSVLGTRGEAVVAMPWYAHRPPVTIEVSYSGGGTERIEAPGENAYYLETEDFAAACRGGKQPEVSAEETLRNLRTIQRLAASAGERQPVWERADEQV